MIVSSLEERRQRLRAHRQAVHDAQKRLRRIEDELFDLALQIALTGPLFAWNESQPVGAFADLDAALTSVEDGRVVALLQLHAAVGTALAQLQRPT